MSGRGLWAIVSPLVIVASLGAPASASESYCVSCSGPQASYLCEVTVPDGIVASQSPQLYCAYRLANEGHHASCASRRADAASCQGEVRKLAYEGASLSTPLTVTTPAAAPADPTLPADGATAEPATGETATVPPLEPAAPAAAIVPAGEEADKDSSRVGEADVDRPAGDDEASTVDKISGVAKSAFHCLTSFFKECKE